MEYNLKDFYYHSISKDNKELIYENFKSIINDKKIKSQKLLGKNENKFNGYDYISLASYNENTEYKSFIIEEEYFSNSKLSNMFNTYKEYLEYMKLDNQLEIPISKEEYFEKNNTNNKLDYYNYLDSISRTYPIDVSYLYEITKDNIYKRIIGLNNDEIINCYKSENCFDEYIRNSKGITFVFPKNIDVINVTIIPNLPTELEFKLVEELKNSNNRYSNQIGEIQVRDYIDITKSIGLILAKDIDIIYIKQLLKDNDLNYSLFKIENEKLIEV